jgi:hypothetical protein
MSESKKASLSLYGITEEFEALEQLLEMDEGEISESLEVLEEEIAGLIKSKTDGYVGYMEHQKDLIDLAKQKIESLRGFIKTRENHIVRLEGYVTNCMDKMDTKQFDGVLYQIKERKPSQVLVVENENEVPPEFTTVETKVKVNKVELKKAVKNGTIKQEGIYIKDGKRSLTFKLKSVKSA